MPHPTMSTSTGRGATAVQAPHLFAGAASGPRNLLHHDTVSGYGLAASTMIHLQPQHATAATTTVRMHKLREKLIIGSTLGPFLSIFVHLDTVTRPLLLHTIKGEGGTLDKKGWTTPSNSNVLSIHSNTRTHPLTETWEPSLSRPACISYYKHFGVKQHEQQRALDVGTFSPNQYRSCVRLAHHQRLRSAASFTCPVSRHPMF
jgi:hypothetical protein